MYIRRWLRESFSLTSVAVVGAGISGLVVARRLRAQADVTVFEKSRGPGGRMATRYAGDFEFDHGAQYFTARSESFLHFLQPLMDRGVVKQWRANVAEFDRGHRLALHAGSDDDARYVGTPRMNSIGKALAEDLPLVSETRIASIARNDGSWQLTDDRGTVYGPYDWLVLTAPAAQTAALGGSCQQLAGFCGDRRMLGCFALMLGFSQPLDLPWQAAVVSNSDVSWIALNSSKPDRQSPFTLVVHSTNEWAETHGEDPTESVIEHLLAEASLVTGADLRAASHSQLHRWRYANIDRQSGPTYFLDAESRLAACGDWCIRGRVEAAFTSASELAELLVASL